MKLASDYGHSRVSEANRPKGAALRPKMSGPNGDGGAIAASTTTKKGIIMDENELMEYLGVGEESGSSETGSGQQTSESVTTGSVPPESGGSDGETAGAGEGQGAEPETQAQDTKDGTGGQEAGQVTTGQEVSGQSASQTAPGQVPDARGVSGQDEVRRGEAYLDEAIKSLGIQDPYSGKLITTKAEYDAYRRRMADERRETILRKSGLSKEEFDDFVANLPEVAKAREDSRRLEDMIRRQRETEAKARVDAELAKITAMDPNVKTLADLTTQENYREIYGLVKRGYDISDAWKLANFDRLRRSAAEASRQAAYNAQSGKAGMVRTTQSGEGNDSVPVPDGVAEIYRGLMPELSAADMRADYNRYIKKSNK